MDQNFLKITYHLGAKKMNAYLKMPSPTYHVLKKEIEMCLFEERKQPRCDIRTYWIDEDQDEIEIVNQCDYEIFMAKRLERQHLQVAPLNLASNEQNEEQMKPVEAEAASKESSSSNSNQSNIPPAAGSYDYAVHERVECDSCLMSPIMGFRYKCIQCPNYDLCQNCEAKHIHSEHMMVRMPTNNCPDVVEAYITGRASGSGRRHGKRSKTSCPFVKTGISVVIDDDNDTNKADAENGEKSDSPGAKERHHGRKHHRRHHRHNFLSHLYEMMHDLAEGGGAAAAAHAMGETASATKTTTTTSSSSTGPETTTKTFTSTSANGTPNPEDPIAVAAAAAAANFAAQHAHVAAVKASEMAAKVAHETALKAAQNMTENMTAGAFQTSTPSSSSSNQKEAEANKEATGEKTDATTTSPVIPSPSLETLAQFLDPQYMKTGIQILNNFSDMFAKMLDPMEVSESNENQIYPNLRKNSATTSTKSSVASNLNSLDSEKKSDNEKILEKEQTKDIEKQPDSDISSHVEIDDLGSDSENESVSESFIKLDAPTKESNVSSKASSKSSTPPQSLDKSQKVMDFAQLSADLKAHIAEEAKKDTATNDTTATIISTTTVTSEPIVTTTTTSTSSMTSNSSNSDTNNDVTPKKPEEKRAVPVYHADQRINNAIHAMMSMGFSNEGAWLTQLLESVNGNIPEALDLMTVAQRNGGL